MSQLLPSLLACQVCFSNQADPLVSGMNSGISVLLGVTGFILLGFATFFITLWRRSIAHSKQLEE